MSNFVKLYGDKLLRSTLWLEAPEVRLVFLGMLAMADWDGIVEAPSVRVLAHALNLEADYVQRALAVLEAPDPESRTPDHEGRRVLRVDGGWRLVNYAKYREARTPKQVADAERQRKHRGTVTERDMSQPSQRVATAGRDTRDKSPDLRSENSDSDSEEELRIAAAALGSCQHEDRADTSQPICSQDAARAWNTAAATHECRAHHTEAHWRKHFVAIADVIATQHRAPEQQHAALQAVCMWWWTAPDGPIVSGRIRQPSTVTPETMARRITSDLEGAYRWYGGRRQYETAETMAELKAKARAAAPRQESEDAE